MGLNLPWLGIISIAAIVVAAAVPLLGKPLDWHDSVSQLWPTSPRRRWVQSTILSLAAAGLCSSLALWLVPHYHLPLITNGVIAVAYLAFMGVAWVPMTDRPGEHSYLHWHFLGGTALATLAVVALGLVVASSPQLPIVTRAVCLASMVLAAGWPLLFFSPAKRWFLALESLIALAFSVAIIMLFRG